MIDRIIDRLLNKMEEEKRSCDNCFYYREGKCLTVAPNDCKDNNYILWYPKEDEDED